MYNTRGEYLLESVLSILHQDYSKTLDIIVWDDGSTDPDTLSMIETISSGVRIKRNRKNKGLPYTLNRALEACETEYMVRMDSDDISNLSRVSKQAQYIEENPVTDVLGTNLIAFDNKSLSREYLFSTNKSEFPEPSDKGNKYWLVNHATCIYRVQSVLDVGGYDESLLRKQDIELWERMYENGAVFRNLTDCLYAWRR